MSYSKEVQKVPSGAMFSFMLDNKRQRDTSLRFLQGTCFSFPIKAARKLTMRLDLLRVTSIAILGFIVDKKLKFRGGITKTTVF